MAVALTSLHSHQLITSPLEPRISASQRAWDKVLPILEEEWSGWSVERATTLERRAAGWHITETVCTWLAWRDTIMPMCDTIKIVAPEGMVTREDLAAPGTIYLALERCFDLEPVVTVMKSVVGVNEVEFLRLQVPDADALADILERAGPDYPARFGPGSIR